MNYAPTIPLRLISMRLPDTMDWIRKRRTSTVDEKGNVLNLLPGQPGEMVLELENEGHRPIDWTLELTGNFPRSWCPPLTPNGDQERRLRADVPGPSETPTNGTLTTPSLVKHYEQRSQIGPGDRHFQSIYIRVPEDFFEAQSALVQQPTLTLEYRGEIYLFACEDEGPDEEHYEEQDGDPDSQQDEPSDTTSENRRLVGYQSFDIQVRPASTYMTLLPEIFQAEDFMVRFLSIFEQTFDPSLQTLGSLWAYLDPLTAPRSMLPFLSKWVAWELDPRWTLQQQRRLMRYAVELYRWRGTRKGVRYYLHLYTNLRLDDDRPEAEKQISITDDTSEAFVFGEATFGEGMMMGGGQPFHFNVVLRPDSADEYNQLDEALIRRVIEHVKPAFCTYTLAIAHPLPTLAPTAEPGEEPDAITLSV